MSDPVLITEDDVERVLSYADLIPLMRETMIELSNGGVIQPTRQMLAVEPEQRYLGIMPTVMRKFMGAKLVTFYPKNAMAGIPTHNASIALLDVEHGRPIAFVAGRLITEMRTAALSAAVSQDLASPKSKVLGLVGSGVQAQAHLEALRTIFPIEDVRVWSRSPANAQSFADQHDGQSCSLEDTVVGADIVVVATNSMEPLVRGEWLKPGAHLNSVGSPRPNWRELHDDVLVHPLVVDSRAAAQAEAGDIILSNAHVLAEAGELFSGAVRIDPSQTTVFKSVGVAVEDIATAHHVYRLLKAERRN